MLMWTGHLIAKGHICPSILQNFWSVVLPYLVFDKTLWFPFASFLPGNIHLLSFKVLLSLLPDEIKHVSDNSRFLLSEKTQQLASGAACGSSWVYRNQDWQWLFVIDLSINIHGEQTCLCESKDRALDLPHVGVWLCVVNGHPQVLHHQDPVWPLPSLTA